MILILSPSKTFNRMIHTYTTSPVFEEDAKQLIEKLKSLSVNKLMKHMSVSKNLAMTAKEDYQHFGDIKTAVIHGYNGHQFRNFDIDTLEERYKNNLNSVYILSALYGLLRAYDGISPYRLEMKDKTIINLYQFWKPKVQSYIKKNFSHETIYNLASDEYGQLIKDLDNVINIQFYTLSEGKLSIHAMEAKRMRGLFARYLIMYPHLEIKGIKLEGYTYSIQHSTQKTYTFVRITS